MTPKNILQNIPKPCVMGVINMSPHSFYNAFQDVSQALPAVKKMVEAGVTFIDVGAEATNPTVDLRNTHSVQEEMDRVIPMVEAIAKRFEVMISVDTSHAKIMRTAVGAGAHLINDQRALKGLDALETVRELQVPVCLMHFFEPKREPESTDLPTLIFQVKNELLERARICIEGGIDRHQIILDPGFGGGNYGKNTRENYFLLAKLDHFIQTGFPILVGWSRKSMIGETLGVPVEERLSGSLAAATVALMHGASIIRTHDVKETMDVLKVINRVMEFRKG